MRKLCGVTCVDFQTPSRNIKCLASASPPGIVGCDIDSGLEPTPPSARCPAGFGDVTGLNVASAGTAVIGCHTDVPPNLLDRHEPVLAYGRVWHGFGVWCLSQESGIVCVNGAGHGFFLSRQRWTTF